MAASAGGDSASAGVSSTTGAAGAAGTVCTTGDCGLNIGAGVGAVAAGPDKDGAGGVMGVAVCGATGEGTVVGGVMAAGGGATCGSTVCAIAGVEPKARTAAIAAKAGRAGMCVLVITMGQRAFRKMISAIFT